MIGGDDIRDQYQNLRNKMIKEVTEHPEMLKTIANQPAITEEMISKIAEEIGEKYPETLKHFGNKPVITHVNHPVDYSIPSEEEMPLPSGEIFDTSTHSFIRITPGLSIWEVAHDFTSIKKAQYAMKDKHTASVEIHDGFYYVEALRKNQVINKLKYKLQKQQQHENTSKTV